MLICEDGVDDDGGDVDPTLAVPEIIDQIVVTFVLSRLKSWKNAFDN